MNITNKFGIRVLLADTPREPLREQAVRALQSLGAVVYGDEAGPGVHDFFVRSSQTREQTIDAFAQRRLGGGQCLVPQELVPE